MEFVGIGPIKLVRFVDLSPMLGFRGLAGGGGGMSKGGDRSCKLRQDLVRWVVLIIIIIAIIVRITIWRTTRGAARRASRGASRGGSGPLAMQGMGWGVTVMTSNSRIPMTCTIAHLRLPS